MVNDETLVMMTLRVPAELYSSIKGLADEDSCSVSSVVRRACAKYVVDRESAKRKRPERIQIDGE